MFERNHLVDLPYPIATQDVHLYKDVLQINIYVYSFSDDEGKVRHPLFTSKNEYPRKAELLYWDEHYAPITDLARFVHDISKHKEHKNICRRCFGSLYTDESIAKHERLCTREDCISVLHVLAAPIIEQAHIKFRQFCNTYEASFVVYADF